MLDTITRHELIHVLYFLCGVIVSGVVSGVTFVLHQRALMKKVTCLSNKQVKM
jgi:hypothetical protein